MLTLLLITPLVGSLLIALMASSPQFSVFKLTQRPLPSFETSLCRGTSLTSPKISPIGLNLQRESFNYCKEKRENINPTKKGYANDSTASASSLLKSVAISTSLVNFFISMIMWFEFDSNTSSYQFVYEFDALSFCHFNLGVDGISLYFVLLTTFITPVALLSNHTTIITKNIPFFLISVLLLETLQIFAFVSLDLLLFYIFFESVLPVIFIIILVLGHGEERIRSALLFFLFTLAGSLPMLLAILLILSYLGTTDLQILNFTEISLEGEILLWLGFFGAFAVKTPLYPFIIWLPKAHGDGPLSGSIILAATILKLATYGYLRVLITSFPESTNTLSPLVQVIALLTLILASFSTIVQQDTKRLIAYSSVCHMGVLVLGLFSNNIQGIEGAILLGIAHGFVSPALFLCVGGIIYDRCKNRLISNIRGLVNYMPLFVIFFFLFTLANAGIPLSLNFLGEQMSLIGVWDRSPIVAILAASSIVFSAMYSIYLYNRLSYGAYLSLLTPLQGTGSLRENALPLQTKLSNSSIQKGNKTLSPLASPLEGGGEEGDMLPIKDLNRREYYLLLSLLLPTFGFGIFPNVILKTIHSSISNILMSN